MKTKVRSKKQNCIEKNKNTQKQNLAKLNKRGRTFGQGLLPEGAVGVGNDQEGRGLRAGGLRGGEQNQQNYQPRDHHFVFFDAKLERGVVRKMSGCW